MIYRVLQIHTVNRVGEVRQPGSPLHNSMRRCKLVE